MEINAVVAERRISTALSKNIPDAADRVYCSSDDVLVYPEKEKEWVGPLKAVTIDGELVIVENQNKSYRGVFNVQQIKKKAA